MIAALTLLLAYQLIGEVLVAALAWPVPGPVVGMLLLLLTLALRGGPPEGLRSTAQTLLQNLSLLFVPAGAGVMVHTALLQAHGVAIAVALVGSTVLSLAVTAWVFRWLARRTGEGS